MIPAAQFGALRQPGSAIPATEEKRLPGAAYDGLMIVLIGE
jgi:hypothetical protein